MRTASTVPAEEAFVLTCGVPHARKDAHCKRVLTVLRQAGYLAAPTSGDALLELAHQEQLNRDLDANDPEGGS